MKQNFLIIGLLLLSFAGFSQTDAAAIALLDEVSAKTEKYSSLKIDFSMYVENLQTKKRDTYVGNASYKAGFYKLDIMGQIVFSDGSYNFV